MESSELSQSDIVNLISGSINDLFSSLFSSIDASLYSILDDLLFIDSDILNNSYLSKIFGDSSNGLIIICNSLLIGISLYYICFFALSHFTFSQTQKPSHFFFKLFFAALALNSSEFIVEKIINLFSNISLAIREVGEFIFNKSICLSTFIENFNSTIYLESVGFNLFSLDGLIKSLVSIGFLNLSISYAIRYVMIKVFVIISPFAFISLVNTNTSWIFKSWFKLFMSLLILQVLVPLILLVSYSIEFNSENALSKLIYIGSVYSLIKSNSFVKDFMGGLSSDANVGFLNFKNILSK